MDENKEQTRNLCAQIPIPLHQRVREEQARSGKTLGKYMTTLITEYYDRKDNPAMKDTNMRTLAIQISAETFDALDKYIAKHPEVKSKKELLTRIIVEFLEREKAAEG